MKDDSQPMDFHVSNMRPIKRSRMHKAQCSHCNHGEGQAGQHKTGSINTGWHGPYNFAEAEAKMSELENDGYDVGKCRCVKKLGLSLDVSSNRRITRTHRRVSAAAAAHLIHARWTQRTTSKC